MSTSEANLGLSLGLRDQHEVTTFHLYKMRNEKQVLLYIILALITHTRTPVEQSKHLQASCNN